VALSPQVGKINPRSHDLMTFWLGCKKSTKPFLWFDDFVAWLQMSWFNDFLGLAADVHKIVPRSWDSMMFWHWQSQSHKSRFDDFVVVAPEVDKINPRSLVLMLCKMSKK
jgi:hypothetical protein